MVADRLRVTFDGARIGFSSLKDWRPVTTINYRPATGPTRAALRQTKAARDFAAAWAVFDAVERVMLTLVVLRNIATGRVADQLGVPKPQFTDRFVAALDKLAEHFEIDRHRRRAA